MSEIDLPIVNIAPFLGGDPAAKARVARAFGAALEDTGFAIITGHGVPEDLAQQTYDAMAGFFDQPMEAKTAYTPPEKAKGRGYLPVGIESVAKTLTGETPPDLCEALVFAAPHRAESDAKNYWPEEPPELERLVREWTGEMTALSRHLARLSALALDLDETFFDADYADPALTLRFVGPQQTPARVVRAGPVAA